MQGQEGSHAVTVGEVLALRAYVAELAGPDEFAQRGATLYGVSCDAVWSQRAFKEQLGVAIEQLSDFEPKGATCRAFGVLNPGGLPERALVMIGPDATVLWSHQADSPADLPGANLIFDALAAAAV